MYVTLWADNKIVRQYGEADNESISIAIENSELATEQVVIYAKPETWEQLVSKIQAILKNPRKE